MEKATLIYDSDCALCRRAAAWAHDRARPNLIELLPCGSLEQLKRFPDLDEGECAAAPQLILESGIMYSGDDLIPPLFDRLKRWHWVGKLLRLPFLTFLAPLGYRTLARNRKNFAVLMYRK